MATRFLSNSNRHRECLHAQEGRQGANCLARGPFIGLANASQFNHGYLPSLCFWVADDNLIAFLKAAGNFPVAIVLYSRSYPDPLYGAAAATHDILRPSAQRTARSGRANTPLCRARSMLTVVGISGRRVYCVAGVNRTTVT